MSTMNCRICDIRLKPDMCSYFCFISDATHFFYTCEACSEVALVSGTWDFVERRMVDSLECYVLNGVILPIPIITMFNHTAVE